MTVILYLVAISLIIATHILIGLIVWFAIVKNHLRNIYHNEGRFNKINTEQNLDTVVFLLSGKKGTVAKVIMAWPMFLFFSIGYGLGEIIYEKKIKNEEDMVASWLE